MTTDPLPDPGPLVVLAHAKLNVSLRVLAREESGFHSIETILLRLELADRIEQRMQQVRFGAEHH